MWRSKRIDFMQWDHVDKNDHITWMIIKGIMRNRVIRMDKTRGSKIKTNIIYILALIMDVKISKVFLESDRLRILETKTPFVMGNLKYQLEGMDHTLFKFIEAKPLPFAVVKISLVKIWTRLVINFCIEFLLQGMFKGNKQRKINTSIDEHRFLG